MLKLHFYNHKTLRHLKKQSFYHCCKCCLCKAYSPDTFQTHLVGKLFEDCGSLIICIEVKREMSQDRSLRNAFSCTSKLALLVTRSKGKIWFWESPIILTMYLFGKNLSSLQVRPQCQTVISIYQSEDHNTVLLLSFKRILDVCDIKQ